MRKYQNWKWEPISKHIASYQSGIASGEKSRESGFAHLRMNNISTRFTLNLDEMWYIPASDEEKRKYSVKKGDLLFNNTNSDDLVGKSCVFNLESDNMFLFSNHITRIRTKDTLDSSYLLYWVKLLWDKKFFKDNCTKWVNQAAVRPEELLFPQEILLPPTIEEQKIIARDLQSQLAHVESMRQAALKQKEAAKALQSAILREVFPWRAGESLPSGWRWEKITDISKNLDGKRIPVTEKLRQKGDIPYYGASGIVDYVKDYLFDEDLLLVSEDGANLVMRTYPIAFSINGKTWVNNHAHVLKFEDKDVQKITEHYINGLDISDFVSGAAQPKLNQDNLNRIKIPIPVEPQIRSGIVERIENEFEAGRRIEKQVEVQLAAIEALPAAILREAFNFEKTEK
jgi:type I restriction enzyme S subunit